MEEFKKPEQICETCGTGNIARLQWVNVNTGKPLIGDPGIYTEWCFGKCQGETKIIENQFIV